MRRLVPRIDEFTQALETYAGPVWDLAARLWIARVFFLSGLVKIRDWDATIDLFQEEYKVPILPPEVAAVPFTAAGSACRCC